MISKEDLSGLIDGTCTDSMIVRLSPHQHTTTMAEVCYLLADDALKSGYNKYVYVCCKIHIFLEFWILLFIAT